MKRPERRRSATNMNLHNIPWRPADEAPAMVPLLCYWCPFPDAEDVEERPEYWGVGVCQRKNGVDHWFMYCPTWEGGLGNPYQGAPDFFAPLGRPDGNPKWKYVYSDAENGNYEPVAHLMGRGSTVHLIGDGCTSRWRTIDTAPRDGTEVDLFHPDYGRITGSHWDPDLESWIILPANSFPTHWMPVPEGP